MSSRTIKAATWNIGGGLRAGARHDDGQPALGYYAAILRKYSPDLVCLQEAHDYSGSQVGQAADLAERCGYPHVVSFPMSTSHLLPHASLALGILSRFPILTAEYKQFPNPGLSVIDPSGDRRSIHDKGFVRATIALGDATVGVINAHCFPYHYFEASATEPRFAYILDTLRQDMKSLARETTALVAVDLNHEPAEDLLAEALGAGGYGNAFANTPTIPRGVQQDYILYGPGLRLITTSVIPTESDHSYCQVSIAL